MIKHKGVDNTTIYVCYNTSIIYSEHDLESIKHVRIRCDGFEPIEVLKGVAKELFNYLDKIKGSVAVNSLPEKYKGSIGKLKTKGFVSIYTLWSPSKVGNKLLLKRQKMVSLNKYMGVMCA